MNSHIALRVAGLRAETNVALESCFSRSQISQQKAVSSPSVLLTARAATDPLAVLLLTPGWPREQASGHTPNGIISYVHNMVYALGEGSGCRMSILSQRVLGDQSGSDLVDVSLLDASNRSDRFRFSELILNKLAPKYAFHKRVAAAILRETERLAREKGLDILQMEESFGWSRFVIPNSPVPVVVRTHGPWFINGEVQGAKHDKDFKQRVRWEGVGIKLADGVTAPSLDILERVRAYYDLPLPNAMVIPNPIRPAGESERWSLATCDRNTILFVGRFDLHKGGDLIIDAYVKLLERKPQSRLVFAGPEAGLIRFEAKPINVYEYIKSKHHIPIEDTNIEIRGVQSFSKLSALRKEAFVTVVPSRYETFGNVLTEAMSQGCPVVASEVGGLREIVWDGYNGLQFRTGDSLDLAHKLLRLFDAPDLAAALGRQALLDCGTKYDYARIALKTVEYYKEVIGKKKRDR